MPALPADGSALSGSPAAEPGEHNSSDSSDSESGCPSDAAIQSETGEVERLKQELRERSQKIRDQEMEIEALEGANAELLEEVANLRNGESSADAMVDKRRKI